MSKIITCEQVSRGHVDKICDQIADAIVADCLRHDPTSRVAVECLIKNSTVIIAGEITSKHEPDYARLVGQVFEQIGIIDQYDKVNVRTLITRQSPDIAQGVDKGGAGDQGVMYGYATNETPELLPIPFAVATRFLELLRDVKTPVLRPDAKAQVSYDYESGKITTFLCSVQHTADSEAEDFRGVIESLMVLTAVEYGLNTDFEKLVNPTGKFVVGGSMADCGVTGRKLACDTYGGVGRIGGGALSGKDPSKTKQSLRSRMQETTGLENPNSVMQMKDWLSGKGVETESLDKKAIKEMLSEADEDVADVLACRQQLAKASVSKYRAMQKAVCADGRARGMFAFYGANRTGRWAGRIIQLQNLPQNHMDDLKEARSLVRDGNFEALELMYDNILNVLSELIRTAFVPKPGYKYIVSDFSAIEARVLSFLAGEQWRIDVFREGKDIYCSSASRISRRKSLWACTA